MNDVSDAQAIQFIRLNNGDDVVAQVIEVGENDQINYILVNPLKVVYMPSQQGAAYLQVAFIPWVFTRICSEQEFIIHAEDIITMSNVSSYMEEYYWKNMDHFITKDEDVSTENEELETEEETSLEELLEAIKSSRRTFH
jgi:hypothetical protein